MAKQSGQIQLNKVLPKTRNQSNFVKAINNSDVTIANGPAGCGKSLISIGLACEKLMSGQVEQILISRTIIGAGYDLGAFKGDVGEKIAPYFTAQVYYLEKVLGPAYKTLIDKKIFLRPLELLRGHTYDNTLMILEEAQNCDGKQLKLFLTRMGQNSKAVIVGDVTQSDTNPAGFRFALNYLNNTEGCSITYLNHDDILRNSKIGHIISVFDANGY